MAKFDDKPEAAPAVDLAKLQDEAIEREYRRLAAYWFGRYLGPDWQQACAAWEIDRRGPRPFRVDQSALDDWLALPLAARSRTESPMQSTVLRLLREAWPDASWAVPIIERFRAKVAAKIAAGWRVLDHGRWRTPTIAEQAEQLAATHADQAAKMGIIPTRERLRGDRALSRARPVERRGAPVDEAERWAAAEATAMALV
ncbi:MAG: hypothetical protein RLZZ127_45 [Planctomycetota bacterium]|jgi:hypothetical protein